MPSPHDRKYVIMSGSFHFSAMMKILQLFLFLAMAVFAAACSDPSDKAKEDKLREAKLNAERETRSLNRRDSLNRREFLLKHGAGAIGAERKVLSPSLSTIRMTRDEIGRWLKETRLNAERETRPLNRRDSLNRREFLLKHGAVGIGAEHKVLSPSLSTIRMTRDEMRRWLKETRDFDERAPERGVGRRMTSPDLSTIHMILDEIRPALSQDEVRCWLKEFAESAPERRATPSRDEMRRLRNCFEGAFERDAILRGDSQNNAWDDFLWGESDLQEIPDLSIYGVTLHGGSQDNAWDNLWLREILNQAHSQHHIARRLARQLAERGFGKVRRPRFHHAVFASSPPVTGGLGFFLLSFPSPEGVKESPSSSFRNFHPARTRC